MKKLLLILVTALILPVIGMAQGGPGGGRQFDPERLVAAEKKLLLDSITGLNDDQKLIIEAIYDDYGSALTSARENMSPDNREAMRKTMIELRDKKSQALKEILTDEQMKSFEAMLERRRAQMRQRRQRRND
jgi:hypothetical protein